MENKIVFVTLCIIKTHGSVSCNPRSWCATPMSILTGRKRNFHTSVALCYLDETRRFLLWTHPPTSVLHIPNLSEIASSVPEICDFKSWLSCFIFFFLFFFLFLHTYKNCHKTRKYYPIALKFGTLKGGYKGTSWYQVWLKYSCHAYRVNHLWEEAENRCMDRLTIEPQTSCG